MIGKKSPWAWVPYLYFAEGLPYFIVNQISIMMFTDLGLSKSAMAMYTSFLYFPWVIKPLWSPFVDVFRTKRWWIVSMQVVILISFLLMIFAIPSADIVGIKNSIQTSGLFYYCLFLFVLTSLASATHDIACDGYYMIALSEKEQSFFVGIRSTFYRLSSWFIQGVFVAIIGVIQRYFTDISTTWKISFAILATIFALMTFYSIFFLPQPSNDVERRDKTDYKIYKDLLNAFVTFFKKKYILVTIAFLLLFRLPEALMLKLIYPFFTEPIAEGGLGLSKDIYGLVYGSVGIISLTIGGILGGIFASKFGLKKSLLPMVAMLTLPSFAYLYLSITQSNNIYLLSCLIGFEQFGYGFGFQAYMLYMIYYSLGEYKTSHYAICTAFMALSMMLPGFFAGVLCDTFGYVTFFGIAMATSILSFIVAMAVKVDKNFGLRENM